MSFHYPDRESLASLETFMRCNESIVRILGLGGEPFTLDTQAAHAFLNIFYSLHRLTNQLALPGDRGTI